VVLLGINIQLWRIDATFQKTQQIIPHILDRFQLMGIVQSNFNGRTFQFELPSQRNFLGSRVSGPFLFSANSYQSVWSVSNVNASFLTFAVVAWKRSQIETGSFLHRLAAPRGQ
jgi:hypothetical protein